MADKTISSLNESTVVEEKQVFPVEDNVSTKKMTIGTLRDFLMNLVNSSFAKNDLSNLSPEGIKYMIPAGSVIAFAGGCEENSDHCKILFGYLYCDGAEVSRDVYKNLFNAIGTIYGKGNYSSTFNLPDFRGMFLRGAGKDADKIGKMQEDAIRNIKGNQLFRWGCMVPIDETNAKITYKKYNAFETDGWAKKQIHSPDGGSSCTTLRFDASNCVPTANENRPVNFAVNYYIKY